MKCSFAIFSNFNIDPRVSARADAQRLLKMQNACAHPMHALCAWIIILSAILNCSVLAQTDPPTDASKVESPQAINQAGDQTFLQSNWSAYEAIHAGNQRLVEGDAASALEAYEHAAELDQNAPEIPFVQGLAQYAQQDYESARRSFERAATAEDAQLASDALYSLGTTYHAQALQQIQEDPETAIESLEQALQRYRMVLDQDSQHEQANDANRKAAAMRRQLREMMQEQEQEQKQESEDGEKDEDQEEEDKEKSDSENQEEGDQDKDQQQQESDEDREQQESEKQDEASKDGEQKDKEQESESSESEEQQEKKEQQAAQQKQEESETSNQAKRQLREMMQAMRDRKKNRQQPVKPVPAKPVEKDW